MQEGWEIVKENKVVTNQLSILATLYVVITPKQHLKKIEMMGMSLQPRFDKKKQCKTDGLVAMDEKC